MFRGVVHPWQCDILEHLTVRNYLALFDDAAYHLLHLEMADVLEAAGPGRRLNWVDVRHGIDYLKELRAGDLVVIEGTCTKIGNASIACRYEMRNARTGDLNAVFEPVSVLFDLETRRSVRIPEAAAGALRERFGLAAAEGTAR